MSFSAYSYLDDAKYDVVHDFKPLGAKSLAPLVSMNPGTLSNKVNPSIETHHLTVDEAVRIQAVTRDYRILHAEARALNHVAIPIPESDFCSDIELLNAYADWTKEIGETAAAIQDLLQARVTPEKMAAVKREIYEDTHTALKMFSRIEQLRDY